MFHVPIPWTVTVGPRELPPRRRPRITLGACLALGAFAVFADPSLGQSTFMIDLDAEGNQGNGFAGSTQISANGQVIAFGSRSANLVPGIRNGYTNIFTLNLGTGEVSLINLGPAGNQANGESSLFQGSISADGRFVAYQSQASNLVPGDFNESQDVFVHDRSTGLTVCASVNASGLPGNGWSSFPTLSADGRFVTFDSSSSDLVPEPATAIQIYVRDLFAGETTRVSVDSTGVPGNSHSSSAVITGDGRFVAFDSLATNLAPGETYGHRNVFLHDRLTGITELISVNVAGNPGNGFSSRPAISDDARFVAFYSLASDLVAGDLNGMSDVFLRDRLLGTTSLVSVSSLGEQGNFGAIGNIAISRDGNVIAFDSKANNLAPGDMQNEPDVFVHERLTGMTFLVSRNTLGYSGNDLSVDPALSGDGRFVTFSSLANDLVQGDTSDDWSAFFHDRLGSTPRIVPYCVSAATTHGCLPSISGVGVPRDAPSGFTIAVSAVEGQATGIVFYGVTGSASLPFGSGSTLCVRGALERMPIQSAGGTLGACDGEISIDWNQYVHGQPGALGKPFLGGRRVWAQAWLREPGAPNGASGLSDALWFTVCP